MADKYINTTKFEAMLLELRGIAEDKGYGMVAETYAIVAELLRQQPRFDRVDVADKSIIDKDAERMIGIENIRQSFERRSAEGLGTYALANGLAKTNVSIIRDGMLKGCTELTLRASFLVPEQPKLRLPKEGDSDA